VRRFIFSSFLNKWSYIARTASYEPELSLGEIMTRLLSVERDNAEIKKENAEIKKENAEQNKKIAELETELSTTRQASIGVCLSSSLFSFFPTHPSYFRPFIGSNCDQQNPPTHPARLGPRQTSNTVWV
jgi:hypothetical protein